MGKYHAFFYECDDTVICKKCNWISRRRKDGSTAGVRHHLKTKHQEVFSELEENDRKRRTAMTEKVAQLLEHGGIKRPFDGTTLEEALAQQPLFKQEKRVHVPVRDPDDDKITGLERAVMQMICTAALPSTIVEDPGFLNLVSKFAPNYKKQPRSYFNRNVLRVLHEEYWSRINALLASASFISFACKSYPSTSSSMLTTLVSAHFIDRDMKPRMAVISAQPCDSGSIPEDKQTCLANAMSSFQIRDEKIHMFIHEGASVKREGEDVLHVKCFDCFSHKLEQAAECGLSALPGLQAGTEPLRKRLLDIATKLIHSEEDREALGEYHYLCSDFRKPIFVKDVSLGWDSLYQTLSYFVEIQESLELFLLEHSHYPTLDKKDWEVIKEVVEVLRPIFLAVESLRNQSYTPISVVIPLYKVILGHLGENSTLSQMKEPIREAIQRAMNGCEGCEDLVLATLVDPRFKHVYFEQEKRSLFVEKAAEILVSLDDGQSNGFGEANNSSNPFMSFWMAHKTAVTPVPFNHTARAAAEVDDYLSREPSFTTDPFEYWRSDIISARYPCIKMLAMKYLSAPASSAEYERIFPNVGLISSELAVSLKDKNMEKFLFLHYNLPIFGFD
ncbi:hypothetical protein Y032_0050g2004 [Ancylostoma ceylanicum]|uniref:HAT C-terminal dimerisation domain-containing protein n=1 Tax=Ancylostoma ceylanicum TaxID=53326 RepID=A0A016U8I9_9BILA|nr:hypothetical protein Y032_0050g2004 [Ancylostoma ceylanicum]